MADMLELGAKSHELHAELAQDLDPEKINVLYLFGSEMKYLYEAVKDKYPEEDLHYYPEDEMDHLIDDLRSDIHENDIVLLKGSHGMHLEKVLDRLK